MIRAPAPRPPIRREGELPTCQGTWEALINRAGAAKLGDRIQGLLHRLRQICASFDVLRSSAYLRPAIVDLHSFLSALVEFLPVAVDRMKDDGDARPELEVGLSLGS